MKAQSFHRFLETRVSGSDAYPRDLGYLRVTEFSPDPQDDDFAQFSR